VWTIAYGSSERDRLNLVPGADGLTGLEVGDAQSGSSQEELNSEKHNARDAVFVVIEVVSVEDAEGLKVYQERASELIAP
jgi:hypothetical protein